MDAYLSWGEQHYPGQSFGANCNVQGELVFNTALTGYVEALTDPSYAGQILVLTQPLIGNYGVDLSQRQSERIQVAGLIVQAYTPAPKAPLNLADWLKADHTPALAGIDTRALTLAIRQNTDLCLGELVSAGLPASPWQPPHPAWVSIREPTLFGEGDKTVLLVDFGVKVALRQRLLDAGLRVLQIPWDAPWPCGEYAGVLLSNGPGDPQNCQGAIAHIRHYLDPQIPVLGVCLGAQLLALAVGGTTRRLAWGHRGVNHPCRDLETGRVYLTSQNHGYVIAEESLPADWQVHFRHQHDQSCAGIRHRFYPWEGVQFHPEGAPGPWDTDFVLARFIQRVKGLL